MYVVSNLVSWLYDQQDVSVFFYEYYSLEKVELKS